MMLRSWIIPAAFAALAHASPVVAQEFAIKAGIAISRLDSEPALDFDERYVSTSFGGHYRLRIGAIALQPELFMISRGGAGNDGAERIRLEYLELPLLLVVPVTIGKLEPYAFGGPMVAFETRCRWIVEEDGLKTNLGCDDPNVFDRNVLDYGATAGAGASYPLGGGRLILEGRHTWGLRNIYDGPQSLTLRNRSIVLAVGYTLNISLDSN